MTLQIRNPHSVLAALETRPQDVSQIIVPSTYLAQEPAKTGGKGPRQPAPENDAWVRVVHLARSKGVKVTSKSGGQVEGKKTHKNPQEGGRVGSAEAIIRERQSLSLEELFSGARDRAGGKGLWLALDTLQDPHNLGAIFRAAAFFGVQGIIMTSERSAPLSASAYDVACGGVEYVPFTLQVNLQRAFEAAKEAGLWILGTSEHAHDDLGSIQKDRPWLLVLGNEESGMRRLTEESCDVLCRISPKGKVTSLNVSVAAGICISKLS